MVGFSPLGSAPLGDDGIQNYDLTANNITSGTPEANNATLTQDHSLTPNAVEPQAPSVSTAALTQDHSLVGSVVEAQAPSVSTVVLTQDHSPTASNLAAGTPEANQATLTQDHGLTASAVLTGSPTVSDADITEDEVLSTGSLVLDSPSLGSPSLSQDHSLTANNITTGRPRIQNASDPEAVVAQEVQEIEQMIGGWTRRAYEVPDGRLVQGEREIQQTYGDKVSVDRKAKSLIKFGRSAELGTGSLETVWTVGGNETYLSTNSISHVSSSSASDTQEVTIEGHTLSNNEFTFVTQTATLNGQNTVALNTDLARVSRIYNSDSTELVGRVVVYENTTLSGGVPTDATKIHIDIPAGFQQSFKAATTFSKNDYFIMTSFYGSVSARQSGSVDFYPEIRQVGEVFRQAGCFTSSTNGGSTEIPLDPPLIVPKNADIRIRCETVTNNLVVFGIFKGYIAKVL